MANQGYAKQIWSRAWFLGGLVMICGISVTLVVANWIRSDHKQIDKLQFQIEVERVKQLFETKVEFYEQMLLGMREWMQWVETPSLREWENRIERLQLDVNFKAMMELGYMPYPMQHDSIWGIRTPDHLKARWGDMLKGNGQIVGYSATTSEWNRETKGIHSQAESWGQTYANAYNGGNFRTTGRFVFGETNVGFRAFLCSYRQETLASPKTDRPSREIARVHNLTGTFFADIDVETLLLSVFGGEPGLVEFDLYAGAVHPKNRLNRLTKTALVNSTNFGQLLGTNYIFAWYGDKWTLSCAPTERFWERSAEQKYWGIIFQSGFLISGVLALAVFILVRSRDQVMRLNSELDNARTILQRHVDDRARLSRDLHDGTVQSLFVMGLGLQRILAEVKHQGAVREVLTGILSDLDRVLSDLRRHLRMTAEERPVKSLGDALQELVGRWNQNGSIRIYVQLPTGDLRVIPSREVVELLAVCQEAVSNALRYSRATRIDINLRRSDHQWILEIKDNGIGFDVSRTKMGNGLRNIQARLESIGGQSTLNSTPGEGTTLTVMLGLMDAESLGNNGGDPTEVSRS